MEAVLEARNRDSFGKNEARRTRREGLVPAVLYGGDGQAAAAISVEPRALLRILHSESGANTLISLKLANAGDTKVLVLQRAKFETLINSHPMIMYRVMRGLARNMHGIVRRMNTESAELSNYIYRTHGRY